MNILQATKSYEDWMRTCTTLVESQIRDKHARMKEDLFSFFRGTFYRWAQLWPEVCGDLSSAPEILAVGDQVLERLKFDIAVVFRLHS